MGDVFGPGNFWVGRGVDNQFNGLVNELASGGVIGDRQTANANFV